MSHCSLLPDMEDPVFDDVHHDEYLELSSWLNDSMPGMVFHDHGDMPKLIKSRTEAPPATATQLTASFQPLPAPVSPSSTSSLCPPEVAELVTMPLPNMSTEAMTTSTKLEPIARVSPTHSINYDSDSSNKHATPEPPAAETKDDDSIDQSVSISSAAAAASSSKDEQSTLKRTIDDVEEEPADRTTKQKKQRRERNREHAKKSRSRKKNLTKSLEEAAILLREENEKLKKLIYEKYNREETAKMVKERIVTPSDRFVAALKRPRSRFLTNSAVSYLRSLRTDIKR